MGCFQTGLTGRSADVTVEPVVRSARFDGTASLHRTFGRAGDPKKFTFSCWVKRAKLGTDQRIFQATSSVSLHDIDDFFRFNADDTLGCRIFSTGNDNYRGDTTAVFRDVANWYHLTYVVDTAQATQANRIKIFVNGVSQALDAYPAQNRACTGMNAAALHYIGRYGLSASEYADMCIADIYFIDGKAVEPVGNFIEANDFGGYIPKEYTGTFGFNGFHLDNQPKNSADLLIQSSHNESSTVFSDSANGIAVTKYGDARHSIFRASPLASDERSMYFDGVNDYIKVGSGSSDFAFGTGDYTVEGWFSFSHLTGVQVLCDLRPFNSIDNNRTLFATTGSGLYMYLGGSNTTLAASGSLTTHRWHHIAFVRSSGTLKTYIDGVEKSSITSSTNHSTDGTPHLGSTPRFTTTYNVNHEAFLQGYAYDLRIINGTAAYTGEFTPPNGKLTATGGSYPSTTNVNTSITSSHTKLIIQPDKNDSSIGDELSNQSLTVTGTVIPGSGPYEQDTTASSIYFDGYSDYLQTATSSDLTFGTGSFTVELWCMTYTANTSGSYIGIISDEVYSEIGGWGVLQRDDELSLYIKNTGGSWVSFVADGALTAYQWHHIAVSYDSSNTTTRLFVDGEVVASGTTSGWNLTGDQVEVGRSTSSAFFNGHAYDVRVTKGSALYTGAFDVPTAPFQIEPTFIGADQSGNRFHFEPTNISATDIRTDVPTDSFCVMSPIDKGSGVTLSEGNLKAVCDGNWDNVRGTMGATSGKFYYEVIGTIATDGSARWNAGIDINQKCEVDTYNDNTGSIVYSLYDGKIYDGAGGNSSATQDQSETNARIGVAVDIDAGKVWFRFNNGSWELSGGDPTSGSSSGSETFTAGSLVQPLFAGYGATFNVYFQESEWTDTAPTGYGEWKTSRLAAPSVTPAGNFNTVLYTGTRDNSNSLGATSNPVSGMGFSPELLWIKDRDNQSTNNGSGYSGHWLFDSVQGSGKALNIDGGYYTGSNDFSGNGTGVSSFTSPTGGFTLGDSEAVNFAYDSDYNGSIDTYERYVAWGWKLGQSGSSSTWAAGNTDPTTEKYNSSAGVSVIRQEESSGSYPMTGVTVNHSLGEAPEFAFVIDVTSNTSDIFAWHKDLDANKYLKLNQSSAQTTGSGYFPSGGSTATTFEIGGDIAGANSSDGWWDIYAYLFTGVEGYSKFGSYTGTGSATSPPFIYTGFEIGWLLTKNIDSGTVHWNLHDAARNPHNVVDERVWPNLPNAKDSNYDKFDFLSNGFRPVTGDAGHNGNGNTIIYAAFSSSSPFKHANAR